MHYLIGQSKQHFGGRVLPTALEVLKVYFCYHKREGVQQKDAVKSAVKRIRQVWAKTRIPITQERNIVCKIESLLDKYRNLCRSKNHGGSTQQAKKDDFVASCNLLFDIAHHVMNVIKIEDDKVFLTDQRSERKYVVGGVDTELAGKEIEGRLREEDRKQKVRYIENPQPVLLTSSSTSNESDLTESEEEFTLEPFKISVEDQSQSTSKIQLKRAKFTTQDIIPSNLASALDRTNVSD